MNSLLEKTWKARVECACGTSKFSRNVEVPAENQLQARERIESAIRLVWKGWTVRFISVPVVVRASVLFALALSVTGCDAGRVNGSHVAAAMMGAGLVLACQVFAGLMLKRSEPAGECATCGEASTTHPTLFCCRRCNPSLFLPVERETPHRQAGEILNEKGLA